MPGRAGISENPGNEYRNFERIFSLEMSYIK